jgi:predicted O-methyltransferase YrrM
MKRLSRTSKQRLEELEELRVLSPDVSAEPDPTHEIGRLITSHATTAGRGEMVEIGGSFGVRFVFLQAQATRMVYAIATAGAEIEPNQQRAQWLTTLAAEYEGYRDELVVIIEKYILQQGAVRAE